MGNKTENKKKNSTTKQVKETVKDVPKQDTTKPKKDKVKKEKKTSVETKTFKEFSACYSELKKQLQEQHNTIVAINRYVRQMESLHNSEVKKAEKMKPRKKGHNGNQTAGFTKEKLIATKLCTFLNVPVGTKLSGPALTKRIWSKLSEKNVSEGDKRVFIVDKLVSETFGVPVGLKSVPSKTGEKDSYRDKSGFNFTTLQKYVSRVQKEFEDSLPKTE